MPEHNAKGERRRVTLDMTKGRQPGKTAAQTLYDNTPTHQIAGRKLAKQTDGGVRQYGPLPKAQLRKGGTIIKKKRPAKRAVRPGPG